MTTKLSVCHITSVHHPFDTRIFYKECTSMLHAGYTVHLIATYDGDEEFKGIKVHGVPPARGKLKRMLKTVWRMYRKAVEIDVPVYHFHDPELIFAGILLKLRGKRVIMDVHEDFPDYIRTKEWIPRPLRIPLAWITGVIEHFSAKVFDHVITVTPDVNDRFRKATSRSIIVRNYPIINELHDENNVYDPESRTDTVVYIGNITRDRAIEEMVRTMEIVQKTHPVRLVLGGNFAPESLEDDMRRLPGFQFVDYRGFLSRDEVADALNTAKAGLVVPLPYSHNLLGYMNKLYEYMSAGLPVIASDFPRWKPIVADTGSGIMVDSRDPHAIADAIAYVFDNAEKAAEMAKAGRHAVETKFNWENEAAKLLAIYEYFHI